MLRSPFRRRCTVLEDAQEIYTFDSTLDYDLFRAVQSLPIKERTVVHLFYFEDLSVREISESLHMNESAVKTTLHRARNHLKDCLKEEGNHE
jgi:RNA polymerase sigma-70 factor (ECF subfamily)